MDTQKPVSVQNTNGAPLTSRRIIRSLKAKADARRSFTERVADWMTDVFGTVEFLIINGVWFVLWIVFNIYPPAGYTPFDPFPFGLLTMIVSLEAIMLSVIVLISQNRASRISDLREEIDLQLDVITEQEVTKLLEMTARLMEKSGISTSDDNLLRSMIRPTNFQKIEQALERQVVEKNGK